MKYKHIIDKTNFELSYLNRFYDKIRKITGFPLIDHHLYNSIGHDKFKIEMVQRPQVEFAVFPDPMMTVGNGEDLGSRDLYVQEEQFDLEHVGDKFWNSILYFYYAKITLYI